MSTPKTRFKPTYDRVLVKITQEENKTQSGFIVVDTQVGHLNAEVVEVSDGVYNDSLGKVKPLNVKVGMNILVSRDAGIKLRLEGEEYKLVRENEILGYIL